MVANEDTVAGIAYFGEAEVQPQVASASEVPSYKLWPPHDVNISSTMALASI